MSRFINVPNGNFFVTVQQGGQIRLNTGFEQGQVVITGDLIVEGNTTTVQSEDLTVRDNIIVVNSGETGAGITLDEAGLRIDRGTLSDGYILFSEDITWRDPNTETTQAGGFVFRNDSGTLVGIRTNSISTGGGDLYLINSGTGVLSVTGTTNYERQVFTYSGSNITGNIIDDDVIPNTRSIVDYIDFQFANVFLPQIGDGEVSISSITVIDEETSGNESVINFAIDGVTVSQLFRDRWEFDEIRIAGTIIETLTSDTDLILKSSGTGNIRVDDVLHINSVPGDDDPSTSPLFPFDGAKIYTSNEGTGKTGIYFANADQTRDELVSKNRALLFGMLF
jgi:hypothetical protein